MMSTTAGSRHDPPQFAQHAKRLPGADLPWLCQQRDDALQRFITSGLPTNRSEDWKYTDLSALTRRTLHPQTTLPAYSLPAVDPPFDCHALDFINGLHNPADSSADPLPDGVTLRSLATLLGSDPDHLRPLLAPARNQQPPGNTLLDLNDSFMADGAIIELAANTVLQRPILLRHRQQRGPGTAPNQAPASFPRQIIRLAENSRATVIESWHSDDHYDGFSDIVTQIELAAGAHLLHLHLQRLGSKASHISSVQIHQSADSDYQSFYFSAGARLARHDIQLHLNASGSACRLDGLTLGGSRSHADQHSHIEHHQPHCRSSEHVRSILSGRSRGIFSGRIIVHPGAVGTDARQISRSLLLSPHAESDSRPQLEIYADDVQCSHGATVGQLDPQALFYLLSRGLAPAPARRLLTQGFGNDAIASVIVPTLNHYLQQQLADWLQTAL